MQIANFDENYLGVGRDRLTDDCVSFLRAVTKDFPRIRHSSSASVGTFAEPTSCQGSSFTYQIG